MNNNLIGVVIDPGHGGDDPGAIGNNQYEKDYSLKISKYMYDRFKELGIPVSITRNTDITLSPTERTNKILSFYGDDPNVIVISNHLNSGGGTGAEIIYALRNSNTLSEQILNNLQQAGQLPRRTYQRTLPSNPNRDYYFIHRNTGTTEPVIIEYGFIDDTTDNTDFLNNNYQELAEAVIKAILTYKNIPYIPPKDNITSNYTVQKGDTLYSISKKYNIPIDTLKEQNNLTTNNLMIGQTLKIPSTNITEDKVLIPQTYTVKSGDTLYSIARQYNTTIEAIKQLNNLPSNLISVNQQIKIPQQQITTTYTVQKGDTLYSISQKYNIPIDTLKQQNNLTTNNLAIGQQLIINNQ